MLRLLQSTGREVAAGDHHTLTVKTGRATIPDLHREIVQSGLPVYGFYARKKLEDLFLHLTQNADDHAGLN